MHWGKVGIHIALFGLTAELSPEPIVPCWPVGSTYSWIQTDRITCQQVNLCANADKTIGLNSYCTKAPPPFFKKKILCSINLCYVWYRTIDICTLMFIFQAPLYNYTLSCSFSYFVMIGQKFIIKIKKLDTNQY